MQSSLEVVKRAIEFKKPDRIPVCFLIEKPHLYKTDFPKEFGNDFLFVSYDRPYKFINESKWEDEWGCIWESMGTTLGEVKKHPLDDWSLLGELKAPDYGNMERYKEAKACVEQNRNKFKVGGLGFFVFEHMHHLRGLIPLMEDFLLEPEMVEKLVDIMTELNIGIVRSYSEIGCDAAIAWEDWGLQDRLMISPALWRRFFKPAYGRIIEELHMRGMKLILHSCGYIADILGDLVDIGVDVLQLDQQDNMGIDFLQAKCGGKICFFCPVDIQTTLSTDNAEAIEEKAKRLIDAFGCYDGGFIAKMYPQPYDIGISEKSMRVMCEAFIKYGCR